MKQLHKVQDAEFMLLFGPHAGHESVPQESANNMKNV